MVCSKTVPGCGMALWKGGAVDVDYVKLYFTSVWNVRLYSKMHRSQFSEFRYLVAPVSIPDIMSTSTHLGQGQMNVCLLSVYWCESDRWYEDKQHSGHMDEFFIFHICVWFIAWQS